MSRQNGLGSWHELEKLAMVGDRDAVLRVISALRSYRQEAELFLHRLEAEQATSKEIRCSFARELREIEAVNTGDTP